MIVTLISDFGTSDYSIGLTKGLLLKCNSNLNLIDITHDVSPHNLIECSYIFKSTYTFFPQNTIHVSLFNVLNRQPSVVLLAKINNQYIITNDNGFLNLSFADEKPIIWKFENSESDNYIDWLQNVGLLINELESTNFEIKSIKLEAYTLQVEANPLKPVVRQNSIECHVLHIDRFGNVVLNISQKEFEAYKMDRKFSILIPRQMPITEISTSYTDLPNSMVFCIINSGGYLEVGMKDTNASQLLGLKAYVKDQMIYNTINISFE